MTGPSTSVRLPRPLVGHRDGSGDGLRAGASTGAGGRLGQALGFDTRSLGSDGPRYIEVKGQAAVGSVALTRNGWMKAQRFGADYWLYIAVDCKTEPQLYVLRDPAAKLEPHKEIEVLRYLVDMTQWRGVAQAVTEGGRA
jgi:hypothetical protein